MFLCFQQELVHRVEGFKHVSWKNDKETDDICNFTFSVTKLSRPNSCSEGTINTETMHEPSAGKVIPEPVGDCGEDSSYLSHVSTVMTHIHALSEDGDIKECGNGCLDMTFDGATLKVSSANGTVAGPDSKSGVTGSNTDLCVTLRTASEDNVPCGQASLPENTEGSEAQGAKDKTVEYCGILKEINLLVDNVQNIAPHFVVSSKVDCDVTLPHDCSTDGNHSNDTFVLAEGSSSHIQSRNCRSFAERSNSQQKIQNTGIK